MVEVEILVVDFFVIFEVGCCGGEVVWLEIIDCVFFLDIFLDVLLLSNVFVKVLSFIGIIGFLLLELLCSVVVIGCWFD